MGDLLAVATTLLPSIILTFCFVEVAVHPRLQKAEILRRECSRDEFEKM